MTIEEKVLTALTDQRRDQAEVFDLISEIPSDERFVMDEAWIRAAADDKLDSWRRLQALKFFVGAFITLPCPIRDFMTRTFGALQTDEPRLVDMTMASFVPFERKPKAKILMATLPIDTPDGPAAIYLSTDAEGQNVELAAVNSEPS